MSRIIHLVAENVKRLKAVNIELGSESLVVVRGMNAQGKTSLIDSIAFVLGGKGVHPPRVIRDGEAKAAIILETEELIVTRKWDSKGTTLEVMSRDGVPAKSPQAVLDKLVGRLSFDPLAFLGLKPKEQLEALKKLVGLDFTENEASHAKWYAERTNAKKRLSEFEGQLVAVEKVEEVQPVDTKTLVFRLQSALGDEAGVKASIAEYARKQKELAAAEKQGLDLTARIAELERQRDGVYARMRTLEAELEIEPSSGEEQRAEVARIEEQMRNAEATNEKARQWTAKQALSARVAAGKAYVEDLDEKLRVLDVEKHDRIAATKMPVEGLSLATDGVNFLGVPLEQASGAERLRVSVGMGLALNPNLRVLLVRDGSLLDKNSVALLEKLAEEADAQVWIEMVGDEGGGIVIEDGSVKP